MKNKDFIRFLSETTGEHQKSSQILVNNIVTAMSDAFVMDNSVIVPNFGVFETKKKMERVIVNPSSGQRMLVPPKLVLTFKPNQTWKDKLKGGR